jgi:type IV secretory pathway VirJ component
MSRWLAVLLLSACAGVAQAADFTMPGGRFGTVSIVSPAGLAESVAIFVSGDGGWNLGVIGMAHHLADAGALVVGVDIRRYLAALARTEPGGCNDLAVDFEELSHSIQKRVGVPDYRLPVLVGYSSGATLVYAALVQSPPGTFAGAMSLGFCADQDCGKRALCRAEGLKYAPNKRGDFVFAPAPGLADPWIALQGQQDAVCDAKAVDAFAAAIPAAKVVRLPKVGHGFSVERNWLPEFVASYREIVAKAEPPPVAAAELRDLPLVEVRGKDETADLALLLTGDGGWSGLDKGVTAEFAARGVATVALNSLRYFWTARSPEETAKDVERVLRHYLAAWKKERIVLVGYSFGADVMPFVLERLPADLRARIRSVSLLGLSSTATFEVKVSGWLGGGGEGLPVKPQIEALKDPPRMLCLYGEGESDTLCPELPAHIAREQVGKGHHFSGDYATLAKRILAF